MQDGSGTTTYSYDTLDRLTTKAAPAGTLSYGYDGAGNLASMASNHVNGILVSYAYDELNRLTTVTDGRLQGNQTTTYTYDPANNIVAVTIPNGSKSVMTYDPMNRLTALTTPVSSYTYTEGPTGNKTAVTEANGRTIDWNYDGVYRLTNETISNDPGNNNGSAAYGLDPVGNRLSENSTLPGINSGAWGYNADDEISSETYDANGNVIREANGDTHTYDSQNHMTSMNNGQVTMVYDGDGNRVAKTVNGVTTQYLVDDLNPTGLPQVVEEVVNGAVTRQYTYGLQRISQQQYINNTWTPSFYVYDGGGSVRQLTDSTGNVTDEYEYDAYGNSFTKSGTTPNNYLYRGEQFDSDLGLYYLRARYYNPGTGRFLSRDPEEGKAIDPKTLHKYLYVGANPIRFIDPTGRELTEYGGPISLATLVAGRLAPEVNLEGTVEVTDGTATIFVQLIEGEVRNPFGIVTLLTEVATALQASEVYIVTTFANQQLQNIAIQRYGFVTVDGFEVWHAFL
jgi:RHS repeat-associated protein